MNTSSKSKKGKEVVPTPSESTGLLGPTEPTSAEVDRPASSRPEKSFIYKVFAVISSAACLFSAVMLLTQISSYMIIRGNVIQHVLRVYLIVFCLCFILAELQFGFFYRILPAFANWFHRGFLYTFVGVISMEQAIAALGLTYPNVPSVLDQAHSLVLQICSIVLFSVGVIYMVMGVFCLRGVWEEMQETYRIRVEQRAAATSIDV